MTERERERVSECMHLCVYTALYKLSLDAFAQTAGWCVEHKQAQDWEEHMVGLSETLALQSLVGAPCSRRRRAGDETETEAGLILSYARHGRSLMKINECIPSHP